MSAGSDPLTALRPTVPAQIAHSTTPSTTVQKRPFAEESQHVGPNGLSRVHQSTSDVGNASDSTAPSEPRSRPIFKMKRTGHSGPFPFPFPGRPAVRPLTDTNHDRLSPSVPSLPSPGSHLSGPDLNASSPQEPTIRKSLHEVSFADSNSPSQSPAQTPTTPSIGGDYMGSRRSSSSFQAPQSTDMLQPEIGIMPDSNSHLKPTVPPDVQKAFDSALDDKPYKVWTDEYGKQLPTAGALIPAGYQQSDDPFFPWLCPVRSCRKLLPSLPGLGKHFCNSHRATRFNDNLDGTLTDIGTYSDPAQGNGKRLNGFARPALIVSKKSMTLEESPMAEMTLHLKAQQAAKRTIPQRGGPHRRSTLKKAASKDDDNTDTDDEPVSRATRSSGKPQKAFSATAEGRRFGMANPDRPYNMWPDEDGTLAPLTNGVLIPDGYKYDTTIAGRPWICPVRTCRRLFKGHVDLGNHFRGHHRGSQLNDNLDGTFSVLATSQDTTPAFVVSRDPMDFEAIAEPMRPIYPHGMASKRVVWVKAAEDEPDTDAMDDPDTDVMDFVADVDLEFATDGRPYREWWDDSEKVVSMAGALIPEGYNLDDTFPNRPWICPVRSCRIVCKFRQGLGYHFTTAHRSSDFNDNGDGTLSVVNFHSRNGPRVVSKKPLDANGEALSAPRLPPTSLEGRQTGKRKSAAAQSRDRSPSEIVSSVSSVTHARYDAADKLWGHICSLVDLPIIARETPEALTLLHLPWIRDLDIVRSTLLADLNRKQIAGMIIQAVGEKSSQACSECRRHDGPFNCCVSLSATAAQKVYSFMASCSRACANCIVRKNPAGCSIRKQGGPWAQALKQRIRDTVTEVDTPMRDDMVDDEESGEDLPTRRRSVRLSLANGDEGMDEDGEGSADEAPPEPEPRRSRLVTFKVPRPAQNGQPTQKHCVNARNLKSPREEDLHMEDWEMDGGRVNKAGKPLAFSTSLTANQNIQVSPNINFQAITIPSGRAHQFQADRTKTRMCALASGKLKVRVGGDEFVIGAQGIFKIVPEAACTVTNRCYIDVVLHVTSMSEA